MKQFKGKTKSGQQQQRHDGIRSLKKLAEELNRTNDAKTKLKGNTSIFLSVTGSQTFICTGCMRFFVSKSEVMIIDLNVVADDLYEFCEMLHLKWRNELKITLVSDWMRVERF